MNVQLYVTLWPTFPHFARFVADKRVAGIRLNSAMVNADTLGNELAEGKTQETDTPLWFDVKGRQLRVLSSHPYDDHLELTLNHPISVQTPTTVLFKAGVDYAQLEHVVDGTHLVFSGGPNYMVYPGESLHIRHPSLCVSGALFCDYEIERIQKAKDAGFDRYFLSYVESSRDIELFREHIGDAPLVAKIENKKGLEYVAREFKKEENLSLMAARGDLYVEIDRPHHIYDALDLIIKKDSEASVGSRLLLTVSENGVPECSDLLELAWLYDRGYHTMMLCDGLCLKEDSLARAINVFESFKEGYVTPRELNKPVQPLALNPSRTRFSRILQTIRD